MATIREIARTMDPLDPPTSMRDLCRRHRWLHKDLKQPWSLRRVVERHADPPSKRIRFLSYNTYLMDIAPWKTVVAVDARGKEIGRTLAGDPEPYDLMALSEVWTDQAMNDITASFGLRAEEPGKLNEAHAVYGPLSNGGGLDGREEEEWDLSAHYRGGLLIISPTYPIVASDRHHFRDRGPEGNLIKDQDYMTNKGVLFARINVGPGCIDLYVTHFYSGHGSLSESHVNQLKELANFVGETHTFNNVAVIAGDFNIDSREPGSYAKIHQVMGDIGMEDVWDIHWTGGFGDEAPNPGGQTTAGDHGDDAEKISFLMNGMAAVSSTAAAAMGKPPNKDARFCAEPTYPDSWMNRPFGGRIDYIFVERYIPQHTFYLDISRIRRRLFERTIPVGAREGMDYLSDHLGLDVTFIASPRPPESIFSDPCSLAADKYRAITADIGKLQRKLLDPKYAKSEVIPELIREAQKEQEKAKDDLDKCRAEHPIDHTPY